MRWGSDGSATWTPRTTVEAMEDEASYRERPAEEGKAEEKMNSTGTIVKTVCREMQ
jgi:hypothetical protein